jgi:hypothetical protein
MGGTFRAVKPTKAIRGHKKSCLASSNPPSWVVATIRKGWSQSLGLCLDTGDTTDMFFGDKLRHIKSTWYPMIIHDISWSLNNCSPVRRLVIGWGVNECQCSCGQTVTSQVLSNEYISRSSIDVLPIYTYIYAHHGLSMMIQPWTSLETGAALQAFWRLVQTIWEGEMPTLLASHPEAICCHDTGWPHGLMDQLHRKLGSHNSTSNQWIHNGFQMMDFICFIFVNMCDFSTTPATMCNSHLGGHIRIAFHDHRDHAPVPPLRSSLPRGPRSSATHLISGRWRPSTKLALRTHSLNHLEGVAVYPGNNTWKYCESIVNASK